MGLRLRKIGQGFAKFCAYLMIFQRFASHSEYPTLNAKHLAKEMKKGALPCMETLKKKFR